MTRIHLARHGETVWHAENRYAGSSNVGLTDLGRDQAVQLGEWASHRDLAAVYASDLDRAVRTAEPAAAAVRRELTIDSRLREVHFGDAEGMTSAELEAAFPTERHAFVRAPARSPLPGGETGIAAIARAWTAILDIAGEFGTSEVLVVSHSTLIRLLVCHAVGIDPDRYRAVFPSLLNVGITTLDMRPDAPPALLAFNTPS